MGLVCVVCAMWCEGCVWCVVVVFISARVILSVWRAVALSEYAWQFLRESLWRMCITSHMCSALYSL